MKFLDKAGMDFSGNARVESRGIDQYFSYPQSCRAQIGCYVPKHRLTHAEKRHETRSTRGSYISYDSTRSPDPSSKGGEINPQRSVTPPSRADASGRLNLCGRVKAVSNLKPKSDKSQRPILRWSKSHCIIRSRAPEISKTVWAFSAV